MPRRAPRPSTVEVFDAVYHAGGKAWDEIPDARAFLDGDAPVPPASAEGPTDWESLKASWAGMRYESNLVGVVVRRGRREGLAVRGRITGRDVRLLFGAEARPLEDQAEALLGKRVNVTGEVRLGKSGDAVSIRVKGLEVLSSSVFRYADWKPIDITGGQDAADYIAELRACD